MAIDPRANSLLVHMSRAQGVEGEEKQKLTVEDILKLFAQASGREFANDRAILA